MKRKPKKKLNPLEKMLEHHLPTCTYFTYSGDRHCSCGRDEAVKQYRALMLLVAQAQTQMFGSQAA